MRKRLKRLRYLTEFSAPLFSARRIKAFGSALHPVQDALGLYKDELMALDAPPATELSAPHPPTATCDAEDQADTRKHHGVGLGLWNRSEVNRAVLGAQVGPNVTQARV